MDRDEFERCWHDNVQQVTAYARRHVGREAAGDIASATFLTAWRKGRQVPSPAHPWLLSVAKGHIRITFEHKVGNVDSPHSSSFLRRAPQMLRTPHSQRWSGQVRSTRLPRYRPLIAKLCCW